MCGVATDLLRRDTPRGCACGPESRDPGPVSFQAFNEFNGRRGVPALGARARRAPLCTESEKKVSSQTFTNAYDIKRPIETRPRAEMRHVTSLLHP